MKKRVRESSRGGIAGPGLLARLALLTVLAGYSAVGCQLSQTRSAEIKVDVEADRRIMKIGVPAGSTVADALRVAGLSLGALDRTDPPAYVLLRGDETIRLIRVEERFRTELRSIPFDRQVLRNESLPEGEERLVQTGSNGQEELTYRAILEDGVQVSEAVIKQVMITTPSSEIVMIGARSALAPIAIPGRLVYLSGGNAWMMETTTATRSILVDTADLDGRVFALSPDGTQLLFTRKSTKPAAAEINTLWMVRTSTETKTPAAYKVSNIVHFAAWYPGSSGSIAFSTVEPRSNAPGWQANNDLYRVTLGNIPAKILEAQSGGIYGWWGTDFAFSPNGRIAYSRPDGLGLVSQDGGYLAPLVSITPLQTHGDWAWAPGIAWGADSQVLYYVDHAPTEVATSPEESQRFDLKALSLENGASVTLAQNVGMFAAPSASARLGEQTGGVYLLAFLQAIFPEQSDVSRYRLAVMDRDGSNRRDLFPAADVPGLEPQRIVWAPDAMAGQAGPLMCVVYQGNLWLVDSESGQARQITGDGLISAVDWK